MQELKHQDLLDKYRASLPEGHQGRPLGIAREFLRWLGSRDCDAEAVKGWVRLRGRKGYSAGSLRLEWGVLRRLYRVNGLEWAFSRGDAPTVQEKDVYAPALAPEDIEAMVGVVLGRIPSLGVPPENPHRAFLALSTVWGMRRQEMADLTPEAVNFKDRLLYVETVKRGRQRYHIIPEEVVPHLEAWGFAQPISLFQLSRIFTQLKAMIGLADDIGHEVGWHSIRRSLTRQMFEVGLSEPVIYAFMRWRRPTSTMALRYATAPTVGRGGVKTILGLEDRRLDEQVMKVHPLLAFWKQNE